jgi:hypothetical protein
LDQLYSTENVIGLKRRTSLSHAIRKREKEKEREGEEKQREREKERQV